MQITKKNTENAGKLFVHFFYSLCLGAIIFNKPVPDWNLKHHNLQAGAWYVFLWTPAKIAWQMYLALSLQKWLTRVSEWIVWSKLIKFQMTLKRKVKPLICCLLLSGTCFSILISVLVWFWPMLWEIWRVMKRCLKAKLQDRWVLAGSWSLLVSTLLSVWLKKNKKAGALQEIDGTQVKSAGTGIFCWIAVGNVIWCGFNQRGDKLQPLHTCHTSPFLVLFPEIVYMKVFSSTDLLIFMIF